MKIFGIGLSKTGTTSLARALEILGYRTRDYMGVTKYTPGDLSSVDLEEIEANDAFTDTPIPSFYRELDTAFPGSKFILTVRDKEGWLRSCKKQFNQKLAAKQNEASIRVFEDLYGTAVFDEEHFSAGYDRFISSVEAYFKDSPEDLLILNVSAGEGWEKLCPFLGKPIPDVPFPKANVTNIRWMNIDNVAKQVRKAGNEILDLYNFLRPDEAISNHAPGLGVVLRYLPAWLKCRLGDTAAAETTARKHACTLLGKQLRGFNQEVPIVFPETSKQLSEQARYSWNHFWLVDPLVRLNSTDTEKKPEFLISVALIEDRFPILGIVHLLHSNVTYYAMSGKGAYRRDRDGKTTAISDLRKENLTPEAALVTGDKISHALDLCLLASKKSEAAASVWDRSKEWQTAAAQTILKESGLRLVECRHGESLSYNKANFDNPCIKVK
jgi:3'-phosphoadenosine 5'-phosphosulfate (PAPS) 3'-phosphatase